MQTIREKMNNLGRLKGRSDFLRVQQSGCKWIARPFILQIDDNEAGRNRFGVTVTKRLEKSAVRRNRMKRRLRAAAYDVLAADGQCRDMLGGETDFVLVARQSLPDTPYADLKRDLRWCLRKLAAQKQENGGSA